jgi:signal transduction histidine kinase
MLPANIERDIAIVSGIEAVPKILDVICKATGLGFAAVARVTESRWICCSARDEIGFGLKAGGELKIETTICNEIRQSGRAVVIDHVSQDPDFSGHPTPAMYGFQSYISMPIVRSDGSFWGTLCAIDPRPSQLRTPQITGMFELFAELLSFQLDASERLRASESALLTARETAQVREQFIAVLGHDLRNPLQALSSGLMVVERAPARLPAMLPVMHKSVHRMGELIDNLMDFARTRLGQGIALAAHEETSLGRHLAQVVEESQTAWPGRHVIYEERLAAHVWCEPARIAQMLSNLLGNALKHGTEAEPVRVTATSDPQRFELSVTNSGPDIPESELGKLFDPYFRGARGAGEGLGLGLYIVAEIARAHGGAIKVISGDRITSFVFSMPSSPDARPLPAR